VHTFSLNVYFFNLEDIEPEQFVGDLCNSHESSTISKATESTNLTGTWNMKMLYLKCYI